MRRSKRLFATALPMLLVEGQMSDLVTKEKADEFIARFPDVDFVDVGGLGHMVAGDRNDHFAGAVVEFLARHAQDVTLCPVHAGVRCLHRGRSPSVPTRTATPRP